MKKSKFILTGTIFAAVALIIFFNFFISLYGNKIIFSRINGEMIKLERVETGDKLQKGLGGRKKLCKNCGMLFIFDEAEKHSFWMKDMRFHIDIVWLFDGEIVYVAQDVSNDYNGIIKPDVPSNAVIEFNAGFLEKNNLNLGDRISY